MAHLAESFEKIQAKWPDDLTALSPNNFRCLEQDGERTRRQEEREIPPSDAESENDGRLSIDRYQGESPFVYWKTGTTGILQNVSRWFTRCHTGGRMTKGWPI